MATTAPNGGWPDATNTGLPPGVTLTASGGLVITKAGTVISGLNITGTVTIQADNVTLENCKITSTGFSIVNIKPGVTGAVVQNNEINGVGSGNDGSIGINGQGTFTGNNIYNVENGINLTGASTITDNYIHGLKASGSPHYDGIQIDGGVSNVTISHNTVINDFGQTSAVMIDNYFGPISNIKVDNNLLVGGGYTVYDDGHFTGGSITGVSFTNNHMGSGGYGITDFNGTNPTYTGNVNDGKTLAATLNTSGNTGSGSGGGSTGGGTGGGGTTGPNAPVITSGNHTTNDNTVTVTGTAAAGSTVTVLDGTTKLGTTTVGSNGSWSYTTAALNDGKHSLTATDTVSGKTSTASSAVTITVDTHAPTAPVLVSDSVVNTNHVQVSGTAEANSAITVYDGTTVVGKATAGSNGSWTFTTGALATGSHVLTATATDAAGNVSGHSQALDPVIGGGGGGTTTPPPSGLTGIVQVGNHYFLGDNGPELSYHGGAVATGQFQDWIPISSVQVAGGGYDVAWKNSSGQFTFWTTDSHGNFTSYPTGGVALAGNSSTVEKYETVFHQDLNGDHTIGVPGSAGGPSNPGSAAAVSITDLADSSKGLVTIKGTADAFSQIKLFDGTTAVGTVKAAADGTWSYTSSSAVSNKMHTYTAQELDSSGHVAATSGSAVLGSSGANTLTSNSGNNLFVGNGHPDTFVFASNFGKDVIKDFNANASSPGHDVIQFSKSVFDSFADVLSHATQSGQNVVITHGADSLTLNNVKLAQLDKHDFHFA